MGNQLDDKNIDMQALVARVSEQPDGTYALYDIWRHLTLGHWQTVHSLCGEASCFLVVREPSKVGTPVREQRLRVLERMLHGYGQKSLALDLGVACSTVASTAKQALAVMGLDCAPSRVPLALVIVAQACEDYARHQAGKMHAFTHGGRPHYIFQLLRPDRHLATLLPPAEVEVMKARIEGQPHELIAHLRRTSQRTVANQLASASRRLGASGRFEIIGRLSQHGLGVPALN